jgi:hypothetical protein
MKIRSRYDWSDIQLYQIQEIDTLPDYDSKLDMMIEQLSILIDTDPYEVKKLPVEEMVKEFKKWEFINETPEPKAHEKIKVNGVKYKLVDFDNMSLAQLVDIEEYVSDGIIKNAHKILSVLYLPYKNILSNELKNYEPNKELEEGLKSLTLDILYPTLVFFYHIVQVYLEGSQQSLEMRMDKMAPMMTKEERKQLGTLRQKLRIELEKSGIG